MASKTIQPNNGGKRKSQNVKAREIYIKKDDHVEISIRDVFLVNTDQIGKFRSDYESFSDRWNT